MCRILLSFVALGALLLSGCTSAAEKPDAAETYQAESVPVELTAEEACTVLQEGLAEAEGVLSGDAGKSAQVSGYANLVGDLESEIPNADEMFPGLLNNLRGHASVLEGSDASAILVSARTLDASVEAVDVFCAPKSLEAGAEFSEVVETELLKNDCAGMEDLGNRVYSLMPTMEPASEEVTEQAKTLIDEMKLLYEDRFPGVADASWMMFSSGDDFDSMMEASEGLMVAADKIDQICGAVDY